MFYSGKAWNKLTEYPIDLKNGADPTVTDEYGETAVDWALKGKNTDIADMIRAVGGRSGKAVVLEF